MKNSRSPGRTRHGFTLLEVLLVLAILVILGSLVTYYFVGMQDQGFSQAAKTQIEMLEDNVTAYKLKVGTYPTTLNDLVQMPSGLTPQKWGGPYLEAGEGIPLDPWGNQYQYTLQSGNQSVSTTGVNVAQFVIVSFGPDGQQGTQDDISNLPEQTATGA